MQFGRTATLPRQNDEAALALWRVPLSLTVASPAYGSRPRPKITYAFRFWLSASELRLRFTGCCQAARPNILALKPIDINDFSAARDVTARRA